MTAAKASAIVVVAYVVTLVMRDRSAAWRHAVLATAVLLAGALPIVERIAPEWGATLLVGLPGASAVRLGAPVSAISVRSVWIAGASVACFTLLAGLVRLVWIESRANRIVPERWTERLDEVMRIADVDRVVSLRETRPGTTPMTWGFLRPTVFLPRDARAWDDERLIAVLAHELAHVKRADWLVQVGADLVARAFWFNPIMWMAVRRMRLEAERACDDAVLNLGADRTEYATHLMEVARSVRGRAAEGMGAPAMARRGMLERRVAAVLNASTNRLPLSALGASATVAAIMAAVIPIAGFGLVPSASVDRASVLGVQRDIMLRFGTEERRFSIVARDVSFWNNRIEGRVELQARLNVDGSLSGVRLAEPAHPDLASAAEVIVRHWRREPARIRGIPVEVPIRMTVDFRR